jgi:hypothetical protein
MNVGTKKIPRKNITLICDKSVHNSKFGIFELLVEKERLADAL